jgi:hypothetical protein
MKRFIILIAILCLNGFAAAERPCELRSNNGGIVFRGKPEALARVEAFAARERAMLQSCGVGKNRVLILQTTNDSEVTPAERLLLAYARGEFPGVVGGAMEARRD